MKTDKIVWQGREGVEKIIAFGFKQKYVWAVFRKAI